MEAAELADEVAVGIGVLVGVVTGGVAVADGVTDGEAVAEIVTECEALKVEVGVCVGEDDCGTVPQAAQTMLAKRAHKKVLVCTKCRTHIRCFFIGNSLYTVNFYESLAHHTHYCNAPDTYSLGLVIGMISIEE